MYWFLLVSFQVAANYKLGICYLRYLYVLIETRELYKISADTTCSANSAIYFCIAETFIVWDVRIGTESTLYTYSYTAFNPIGLNYTQSANAAVITTVLAFKNDSHIGSKIIINGIKALLGYSIICNGMKINLTNDDFFTSEFHSSLQLLFYSNFWTLYVDETLLLPSHILVKPIDLLENKVNFNISWELTKTLSYRFHFLIILSSSNDEVIKRVQNPSFLQVMDNNTLYEINVFICHNGSNTSQFNFGKLYHFVVTFV